MRPGHCRGWHDVLRLEDHTIGFGVVVRDAIARTEPLQNPAEPSH
jgi:hypothetical protein